MKELIEIQAKLVAPKGQYNKFGGYKYRSCEDILAAVKPLLHEHGCFVLLSDDIKEIGSQYDFHSYDKDERGKEQKIDYIGTRVYVEATATIINSSGEQVSVKAYAREEITKRGTDSAQLTGATSSYARKYALCGLFAIDGEDDADATNTHGQTTPAAKPAAAKKVTSTTKPAAKPAQYATEPPAAQQPEVPKEQIKKFLEVSISNTTKAAFLKAFNDLKTHNPEFNSVYWRDQANKYYASLAE